MGLLDRVKNLFTEEVEEEMPIKKEVKHVEIANPRREILKEEANIEPREEAKKEMVSDSIVLNREEKFKFPVYFDDKDFEDLPKREEKKKEEPKKEEPKKVEPYKAAKMVEEKKNFRPSPIISPVYGVLDKNYKKDDITSKKEKTRYYKKEENLTIDDVRKKAYGTLEDELEDTLFSSEPLVFEQEQEKEIETEIDIFKELEDADMKRSARSEDLLTSDALDEKEDSVDLAKELEKQKQKIEEINEFIKQNTVAKEKEDVFEEVKEESKEELDNGDLFNLIDSMYEKREEE